MIKINTFHSIKINNKEVGYIQLVQREIPQIEYQLDEEHWNKGIMTKELKGYLKRIKNKFPKLLAIVEKENLASQRVLEKCGFILMTKNNKHLIFVNDLQANSEKKKIMRELIEQGFVKKLEKASRLSNISLEAVK